MVGTEGRAMGEVTFRVERQAWVLPESFLGAGKKCGICFKFDRTSLESFSSDTIHCGLEKISLTVV